MNYRHAAWRKLYREEQGDFSRLSWYARAAALMLLKPCDDAGRISIGPLQPGETPSKALAKTISYRMGGTPADRRMMSKSFALLFQEGYLVHRAPFVVIRNFTIAQRKHADDDIDTGKGRPEETELAQAEQPIPDPSLTYPLPIPDPSLTHPLPIPDPSLTYPLPIPDPSLTHPLPIPVTKEDPSTRNHRSDAPRTPARARSSDLICSEESRSEESRVESGSEGGVVAVADPTAPPGPDAAAAPGLNPPGPGADSEPKHALELWDIVDVVERESKSKVRMTVMGESAVSLQAILDDLARQGWVREDFVAWARYAAAGQDDWWVGPYTTAALMGKPAADGSRAGSGLLRCLEISRSRRRKPANGVIPKVHDVNSVSLMNFLPPEEKEKSMVALREARERFKKELAKDAQ